MARVFFPQFKKGKEGVKISKGTILEAARKLGVEIISECGGKGICGKCTVRIEKGEENLNPPTDIEKKFNLRKNERLACQSKIIGGGDIYIFVKSVGKFSILLDTLEDKIKINPFVSRKNNLVVWNGEVLDKDRGSIYGLAIDVGTTTLVLQVVDLETGEKIATIADKNPQASYGDDVISRIDWTMRKKDGLRELHQVIISAVNKALAKINKEKGQIGEKIYEVVVVGNSTMRNIFFGLDVSSLGVIPFEPQNKKPINQKASYLNLAVNPKANVYGAPLIGGHAGADALADIVVTEIYTCKKVSMIIDIGTNGEVVIGNKNKVLTASCAAGGAYEGATVGSGIGAVEGAIKNVKIVNGRVEYETIGAKPTIGICGSGLIDLLGELLKNGIMDKKAKLKRDFYITKNIGISQQDIYQLITAKAGLRVDQDLLIKYYGTTLDKIDKIYLSGAFGNFVDLNNAIAIGLLPDAKGKIVKIGNGALAGARQMLISQEKRKMAEDVVKKIEHVKANEREKDFIFLIAEKMYF
ncbi:MAG: ASKHA domain-containing protein [Candidatus Aerophobetes bacterium]|nr:ASKHA domain-containing protein [Candidatus Aerophobetes bacterium]